jgi:hypothetical protein
MSGNEVDIVTIYGNWDQGRYFTQPIMKCIFSQLCQLQIKSEITQVIMKSILCPLLAITNILGIYTGSNEVQIIIIAGNCI